MAHYNDLSYLGANAPNVNAETGILYGWISQHSLHPEAVSDIIDNGTDLTYAAAVDDAKARIAAALRPVFDDLGVLPYGLSADRQKLSTEYLATATDSVWDGIEQDFNDRYESDASSYRYERDGYTLLLASDGDICVIASPFYTYAAFGSPCIPNAGHLDTPCSLQDGGVRTYCLAGDWFEDETAPYPVYRVDGTQTVTR